MIKVLKIARILCFGICVFATFGLGQALAKQDRVALVIGNFNYKRDALEATSTSVQQITQKLESLGYTVLSQQDVSFYQFRKRVEEFADVASDAEFALFVYIGHGIRLKDSDYLIPVDVNLRNRQDLQKLTWLNEAISAGNNASYFVGILDTCKRSRLAEGWGEKFGKGPLCGTSTDFTSLLQENSILAFANSNVEESSDGSASNSKIEYLSIFADQIKPDIEVITAIEETHKRIRELSSNQQEPIYYGQITAGLKLQAPRSASVESTETLDQVEPTEPVASIELPSESAESESIESESAESESAESESVESESVESESAEPPIGQTTVSSEESTSSQTSSQAAVAEPKTRISDEEQREVLRKIVAVKNAIAAGESEVLLTLVSPGPTRDLYVQLLTEYEKIDIEVLSTSTSSNSGQISGVLSINKMYRSNGDEVKPADSYRERSLTSRKISDGLWTSLY